MSKLPACVTCDTDVTTMEAKGVSMSKDARGDWRCTACHPDTGVSTEFGGIIGVADFRCGYCGVDTVGRPDNPMVGIDRDGKKRCLHCHRLKLLAE